VKSRRELGSGVGDAVQRFVAFREACARPRTGANFDLVNTGDLETIHRALSAVQDTVGTLTFLPCDRDDVFELIDRVEAELHASHPNARTMGSFLNSIARSLRAQAEARDACLVLEDAMEQVGIPSTWQAGV
jgi:hypothetical protein